MAMRSAEQCRKLLLHRLVLCNEPLPVSAPSIPHVSALLQDTLAPSDRNQETVDRAFGRAMNTLSQKEPG